MEQPFPRSVRTKSGERGSYQAGARIGAQAVSAASNFSTEAYYRLREPTRSRKMNLCSTSSDDSTTEEDSFSCELHGRLCRKANGTTVNKLIDEVVPRVAEKRRSSSVIARLMGLDELPSPQIASDLKNESENLFVKKSFSGLLEKNELPGNHSPNVSRRKNQNLKTFNDFFDSSKDKKHISRVAQKEKRHPMAFIKQQFIEANRLAPYESHKKSKEFHDALEVLDSNRDIFLKFLQKPNSLLAKHFHDFKRSKSSSHNRHYDILESSACNTQEKSRTFYRSVEINKPQTRTKKGIAQSHTRPNSSLHCHSTYDHVGSLFPKFLRSQYTSKNETSLLSTTDSIVVLESSAQNSLSTGRTKLFPMYLQNYKFSCSEHRQFRRELFDERSKQHGLHDVKTKEGRTKAANYISSDATEQIKQSLRSYPEEAFKINIYDSSTCLSKPSLSREVMKSLTEQWKKRPYRQRLVGEGIRTLGELLSLLDKERPKTMGQHILKNKSDKHSNKEDIYCSWAYPSSISSSDGWQSEADAFLQRFVDHKKVSSINGSSKSENKCQPGCINFLEDCYMLKDVLNLKKDDLQNSTIESEHSLPRKSMYHNNKPQLCRSGGEESNIPVREVEVCQNEPKNMINLNKLVEPKPIHLQRKMDDLMYLVCNSTDLQNLNSNRSFLTNLQEFRQSAKLNDFSIVAFQSGVHEKAAERLSPVSVLEPHSEDEKSTPEYLKRIGAGLQDLQRQLNLLELETVNSGDEQPNPFSLNDETSKNGGERDYLYLLDVLTASGIYLSSKSKFFDACYSPDNPVFPDVFDKLEPKHNAASATNSWPRSERKLLFDHINLVLSEVLATSMDLHPWVVKSRRSISHGYGKVVDESWRLLNRQRGELVRGKPEEKVLDAQWLYLDDHIDMVGREIEKMLKDDLLDELVSEFLTG